MARKPKSALGAVTANRSDDDTVAVEILKDREEWSEFELSDGTKIRMKPVVTEIRRYKNRYANTGDPIYQVKSTTVFDTRSPVSLRKKKRTRR